MAVDVDGLDVGLGRACSGTTRAFYDPPDQRQQRIPLPLQVPGRAQRWPGQAGDADQTTHPGQ